MFKKKFNITQDADFIASDSAPVDDVHAFEHEDGPAPDLNHLAFDLRRGHSSLWNSAVIEQLLREFQRTCEDENWSIKKQDNYIRELLRNRYKKIRTTWFSGQPKITRNGRLETTEEVEARLVNQINKQGKSSRQGTRRRNVGRLTYIRFVLMPLYPQEIHPPSHHS